MERAGFKPQAPAEPNPSGKQAAQDEQDNDLAAGPASSSGFNRLRRSSHSQTIIGDLCGVIDLTARSAMTQGRTERHPRPLKCRANPLLAAGENRQLQPIYC